MPEHGAADISAVLACPACQSPLQPGPAGQAGLACGHCDAVYAETDGYLDFAPKVTAPSGLGMRYLHDPLHVPRYEPLTRPAFLRIMARAWREELNENLEHTYIREHLLPAGGPVLDLACGAGHFTRTVADHVGIDRVIGLDISAPMLTTIHTALPELTLLRASALQLPIATGSLGAVNCSNALQLLPNPHLVLAEVGRCLQIGGTLTVFTYRQATSPAYRYFQHQHERVFNVRSFRTPDLESWLATAGMKVLHQAGPACALFLTARRIG